MGDTSKGTGGEREAIETCEYCGHHVPLRTTFDLRWAGFACCDRDACAEREGTPCACAGCRAGRGECERCGDGSALLDDNGLCVGCAPRVDVAPVSPATAEAA